MSFLSKKKIIIIGAGACGVGAAYRLNELGYTNYLIYEKNDYFGGLSATFKDEKGFYWDIGGHVLFSHYDYFDRALKGAISSENWLYHEREAWIWILKSFIPYPFQYNIRKLPQRELVECIIGLLNCHKKKNTINFREWILKNFGQGIADLFMFPYNKKVWSYPPEDLSCSWLGERVAVPDLNRIMDNIKDEKDDISWGPNSTFCFPLRGGTGAIWKGIGKKIPENKVFFNYELESLDIERKKIKFINKEEQSYDYLISTIPLTELLLKAELIKKKESLQYFYSSSHVVGVGIEGQVPEKLKSKCWLYFPEKDNPTYRVTVFSNYSPNNVPKGTWSLMGEVSESFKKRVNKETLIEDVINGFYNIELLNKNDSIVSIWKYKAPFGYPTPFINRDSLLNQHLDNFKKINIFSRGRFGAWKYECGNMDHSFMQGVEAVNNILFGTPELTLNYPGFVNSNRVY